MKDHVSHTCFTPTRMLLAAVGRVKESMAMITSLPHCSQTLSVPLGPARLAFVNQFVTSNQHLIVNKTDIVRINGMWKC